jgi:hypothetical protein
VRYAPGRSPFGDWVYNAADIDKSKVVWAREMDMASTSRLISYYKDREVWLVQPDSSPPKVSPYPVHPNGPAVEVGQAERSSASAY